MSFGGRTGLGEVFLPGFSGRVGTEQMGMWLCVLYSGYKEELSLDGAQRTLSSATEEEREQARK